MEKMVSFKDLLPSFFENQRGSFLERVFIPFWKVVSGGSALCNVMLRQGIKFPQDSTSLPWEENEASALWVSGAGSGTRGRDKPSGISNGNGLCAIAVYMR